MTNCICNWDGSIGIAHIDERCPLLFIQLRYMDMASNVTLEFLISVIYDYHNTFDMIFPGVKEMVILKLSQNKLNITPIKTQFYLCF